MTRFDQFYLMVIDYGINRNSFFNIDSRLNGLPRMRPNKKCIHSDGTQLGQTMYNIRIQKKKINAEQRKKLEEIGFFNPWISPMHRKKMLEEKRKIMAKGG